MLKFVKNGVTLMGLENSSQACTFKLPENFLVLI